jgi:hypothetical protein
MISKDDMKTNYENLIRTFSERNKLTLEVVLLDIDQSECCCCGQPEEGRPLVVNIGNQNLDYICPECVKQLVDEFCGRILEMKNNAVGRLFDAIGYATERDALYLLPFLAKCKATSVQDLRKPSVRSNNND